MSYEYSFVKLILPEKCSKNGISYKNVQNRVIHFPFLVAEFSILIFYLHTLQDQSFQTHYGLQYALSFWHQLIIKKIERGKILGANVVKRTIGFRNMRYALCYLC